MLHGSSGGAEEGKEILLEFELYTADLLVGAEQLSMWLWWECWHCMLDLAMALHPPHNSQVCDC
jgi:hypothetical protein